MILLWGLPGDDPLDAIASALARDQAEHILLDQRQLLDQAIEVKLDATLDGVLWTGSHRLALAAVTALYIRVSDSRALLSTTDPPARTRALEVETTLCAWADEAPLRVINRPSAMASNSSKPYQAALILRAGFLVPDTLVTTDPEAAIEFWDRHEQVVYKSLSDVRSVVSRLRSPHRERLRDVLWCPTQFQAYVPGTDHRVHVVGDDIFATEVVSDADDYRYALRQGTTCELRATTLPAEVADQAFEAARALKLPVCGIDLRRTPAGAWYCFEVNPSPCFTYYEYHTGQPITDAVAAFLSSTLAV